MTIPDRVAAAALLLETDPPPWLDRPARAVAEVAGWLALRVERRGITVDRRLVESAALLHDVDKALGSDRPERSLPHGEGSAAWLTRRGHGELSPIVAAHPVTRLEDGRWFEGWLGAATREARIVAYADKRAGGRLESMDERFASWRRRYPGGWEEGEATRVRERAARLETLVCGEAGVEPSGVRRLGWTAGALVRAAR